MDVSPALAELSEALTAAGIRHQPLGHVAGYWLEEHRVSLLLDAGTKQETLELVEAKPQAAVLIVRGEKSFRFLVGLFRRQHLLWESLRDQPDAGLSTK